MRGFAFRASLVVVVMAAAALVPLAGPVAASAVSPRWSLTAVYKPESEVASISALSTRDAWVAGTKCGSPCDTSTLLVGHWNGRKWSLITPPKPFVNNSEEASASAVAPVSASAAWVFADENVVVNHSFALLRSGSSWPVVTKLATGTSITTAVAPSAKDAWAFGEDVSTFSPYAAHYNGHSWASVKFGLLGTAASAVSASDIWVIGNLPTVPKSRVRATIEHYDGKTWHAASLPKITLPAGEVLDAAALDAAAADNVWAAAVPVSQTTGGAGEGIVLLHYNGKTWAQVRVPYPVQSAENSFLVSADGQGGCWLSADQAAGGQYRPYLYHHSGRSWTRIPVPAGHGDASELLSLSLVPGTTRLWAAGHEVPFPANPDQTEQGVILSYGP
jgi:hypothetical protein